MGRCREEKRKKKRKRKKKMEIRTIYVVQSKQTISIDVLSGPLAFSFAEKPISHPFTIVVPQSPQLPDPPVPLSRHSSRRAWTMRLLVPCSPKSGAGACVRACGGGVRSVGCGAGVALDLAMQNRVKSVRKPPPRPPGEGCSGTFFFFFFSFFFLRTNQLLNSSTPTHKAASPLRPSSVKVIHHLPGPRHLAGCE